MTTKNFRHGERAHHYSPREPGFPRKTMIGAGILGGIVATSLAVTAATGAVGYKDSAMLHTEYASFFEVGALSSDATVAMLGSDPLTLRFTEGTNFVPGSTVQFSVDLVNNSPSLGAAVQLDLAGSSSAQLVLENVRVSMSAQRGEETTTLLGTPQEPAASTVTLAEASAQLQDPLDRRATEPLVVGDLWDGPAGSRNIITIYIHLLDNEALTTISEGALATTLKVTGRSYL